MGNSFLPITSISVRRGDLIINFNNSTSGICGENSLYGALEINNFSSEGTNIYKVDLIKNRCRKYKNVYNRKGKLKYGPNKLNYKIDHTSTDLICSSSWPAGVQYPCVKRTKHKGSWSLEKKNHQLIYNYKVGKNSGQCIFEEI